MIKVFSLYSEYDEVKKLELPTFYFPESFEYTDKFNKDIIIRWGIGKRNKGRDGYIRDFDHTINRGFNIKSNYNKKLSLEKLSKVVKTPKIYNRFVPNRQNAVIRPFRHSSGDDFNVVNGPFYIPQNYYGTQFINTDTEYRVWFAGNKTLLARRVRLKNNVISKYPCRSQWGYKFIGDTPHKLHNDTLKAAKKLGLDFGAADVLFFNEEYYFLEINTAPSCDHYKVRHFLRAGLLDLCKLKFPDKISRNDKRLFLR